MRAGLPSTVLDPRLPRPTTDPHPLIVWIHGGGWIYGSRRRLPPHLLDNAVHDQMLDAGYAVAAHGNWSYAAARCRGLA